MVCRSGCRVLGLALLGFVLLLALTCEYPNAVLHSTPCAAVWVCLVHLASDDEDAECEYGEDYEHGSRVGVMAASP
jgi:hypothetical protein